MNYVQLQNMKLKGIEKYVGSDKTRVYYYLSTQT